MKKIFFVVLLIIILITCLGVVSFADETDSISEYNINEGTYSLIFPFDYPTATIYFNFSFMKEDFVGYEVDGIRCYYYFLRSDGTKKKIFDQGFFESDIDIDSDFVVVSENQVVSMNSDQCLALDVFIPGCYELAPSDVEPDVPTDAEKLSVFSVFTAIIEWFILSISSVVAIFYSVSNGFTIVGVFAIITVFIALSCIIVAIVRSLFKSHS